MEIIVVIPGFICLLVLLRRGTTGAMLYAFLPILLLGPMYYFWNARPLPPISAIEAMLIPLACGMVLLDIKRWRFSRTDLWVAIFIFTTFCSDYYFNERTTDATFELFVSITTGLFPYMAGKLLIEQTGIRVKFVKMYVMIIAVSAVYSAIEYPAKTNPYNKFYQHFFPGQWGGVTQLRWGFGRVGGPFGQSELAGMMVFTALLFALWLGYTNYEERAMRNPPPPGLPRYKLIVGALVVLQFVTQARGPWIGAGIALAVAAVGRARRPLRWAIVVAVAILAIGLPAYTFGKDYLAGPRKDFGSEKETAQYRAELISNYIPVAALGGYWGWGPRFPRINGQNSIDNDFLWVWMLQGSVGLAMLLLMFAETFWLLGVKAVRAPTVRERHFLITMFAIVAGMAFTLTTVFMGDQTYVLFFLLIGWTQGIPSVKLIPVDVREEEIYRLEEKPVEFHAVT